MSHSACPSQKQAQTSALPVISVNNEIIDEQALAEELQYHPHPEFSQVVQKAGQALVIRRLLQNELARMPAQKDADEEAQIAALIEKHVVTAKPDEADCRRYFEQNTEKFTGAPLLEVDHILLAAHKDDITKRHQQTQKANQLLNELQQKPELFADYAARFSDCPSKTQGGSLGQISKGQTVEEFERQLFLLPEGLAQKPIESRYGIHLVYLRRRIDGKAQTFEMVQPKIEQYLFHRSKHLAVQKYLYGLIDKAEIEGIQMQFDEDNIYH